MRDLLHGAAERAARYLESLGERPVFPPPTALEGLRALATGEYFAFLGDEMGEATLPVDINPIPVFSAAARSVRWSGRSYPPARPARWCRASCRSTRAAGRYPTAGSADDLPPYDCRARRLHLPIA